MGDFALLSSYAEAVRATQGDFVTPSSRTTLLRIRGHSCCHLRCDTNGISLDGKDLCFSTAGPWRKSFLFKSFHLYIVVTTWLLKSLPSSLT